MGKKKDETKPDRPAAPLPSITAPRFQREDGPQQEVSITSPNTAPALDGPEERTNTETVLDPSAYAPPADKNPHELSSDFAPVSGKQLDMGGRLVAQPADPGRVAPYFPTMELTPQPIPNPLHGRAPTPAPPPARPPPMAALEADTETAVPKHRPVRKPADPKAPEPPVQQVAGERREPGRWILNRDGQVSLEGGSEVEPGAFDPTVRRAAPANPKRASRRTLIVGGALVVAALVTGATVWAIRQDPAPDPAPVTPAPAQDQATSDPEPARIRLTSKPSGAAVHVNGVSLGVTPVDRVSPFAPEAELEVEVLLKGYRSWTRRFHAGQSVSAHAQLKPSR